MAYKPIRRGQRRSFRRGKSLSNFGVPRYEEGDRIGFFLVLRYEGHSAINKRTAEQMSKAQHWYRCTCDCGIEEYRSQQELIDTRRKQCCFECRDLLYADEDKKDDHNFIGSNSN